MLFGSWLSTTDSTRHEPSPSGGFLPNNPGKGALIILVNRRREEAVPVPSAGSRPRHREKAFTAAA